MQVAADYAIASQMICLDRADVDALYAALEPGFDGLAAGRVRTPFHQPYTMREFHI